MVKDLLILISRIFISSFTTLYPLILIERGFNPENLALLAVFSVISSIISGYLWIKIKVKNRIGSHVFSFLTITIALYLLKNPGLDVLQILLLFLVLLTLSNGVYYISTLIILDKEKDKKKAYSDIEFLSNVGYFIGTLILIPINIIIGESSKTLLLVSYGLILIELIYLILFDKFAFEELKKFIRDFLTKEEVSILSTIESFVDKIEEKAIKPLDRISIYNLRFDPTVNVSLFSPIKIFPKFMVKEQLVTYSLIALYWAGSGIFFPQLSFVEKKIVKLSDNIIILTSIISNIVLLVAIKQVKNMKFYQTKFSYVLRIVLTCLLFLSYFVNSITIKAIFVEVFKILMAYSWPFVYIPLTSKVVEKFGKDALGYFNFYSNIGYLVTSLISGYLIYFGYFVNAGIALLIYLIGFVLIFKKM